MAHECFNCSNDCFCNGDIDDCIVSYTPDYCDSCGCLGDATKADPIDSDELFWNEDFNGTNP